MELGTQYLGLELDNPLVPSASPLSVPPTTRVACPRWPTTGSDASHPPAKQSSKKPCPKPAAARWTSSMI